ncbi:MAG: protein TolR [Gammaproteobacteria bacterium]|nr:protein TolR [Gammaproteobacteria bacterium]
MKPRVVKKRPMSEINVVPYIDVMLVLLVIFMITTPLLTQGVKVNLPKAKANAIAEKHQEPIIVSVDKEGLYYLNVADKPSQPMTARALTNLVSANLSLAKEAGTSRQVFVRGDSAVDYGKVVVAMTLLQQAGAENIGLITESPAKEEA